MANNKDGEDTDSLCRINMDQNATANNNNAATLSITIRLDATLALNTGSSNGQLSLTDLSPGQRVDWLVEQATRHWSIGPNGQGGRRLLGLEREEDGRVLKLSSNLKDARLVNRDILILVDIEKESSKPSSLSKYLQINVWYLLSIFIILVSIIALISIITIYVTTETQFTSYGIVVDAGSTASKLHLYSWKDRPNRHNGAVREIADCVTPEGLSAFENNIKTAAFDIQSCINSTLLPKIPVDMIAKTYVYMGATAGMRKLSYTNPNVSHEIMQQVRKGLDAYGFILDDPGRQVRIISGAEEGVFGWITVNYLLHNFGQFEDSVFVQNPTPPDQTEGALDLGGASTQISFVQPPRLYPVPDGDVTKLRLYGTTYNVYSHSYLCYGKSMAHIRLLALLSRDSNYSSSIQNPCQPRDSQTSHTVSDVFSKPCVSGRYAKSIYGYEITPPSWAYKNNNKILSNGTSNPFECVSYIKQLFDNSHPCKQQRCSFNNVYQPEINGSFVAMSAFYWVMDFYNMTVRPDLRDGRPATYQEYEQGIYEFCGKTWAAIQNTPVSKPEFLAVYCFDGLYVQQLLINMGFNATNWNNITFKRKVNNDKVSWALGFMIDQSGLITPIISALSLDNTTFILITVLFAVMLMCGLIFLAIGVNTARQHFVHHHEEGESDQSPGNHIRMGESNHNTGEGPAYGTI